MTNGLLVIMIMLQAFIVVQNMVIWNRLTRQDKEARLEEKVQSAMDDEARRSRSMDEGFDNLMSYEVNLGRGVMTGGEP